MYTKILLPIDGSKIAAKAIEHTSWIAKKSSAEIILFTSVDTTIYSGFPVDDTILRVKEYITSEAETVIDDVLNLLKAKDPDLKISTRIEEGSPSNVALKLIDEENIDLVIMGTSGKEGIDKFLLGSVTEKILRSAKCPVLVVH